MAHPMAQPGGIGRLEALAIAAAVLATTSSAAGWQPLHLATKPLALALLLVIAWRAQPPGRFRALLCAALAFSLAGDVFLMLPDRFIPGLASFLLAHLAYIALLRIGVPLLPGRVALAGTLAAAAAMVAVLWPHLGAVLRIAVPLYALAIAVMAAQAIGRALVLRDAASRGVAAGAVLFMLSDTLLAINRFATPLPLAGLWVLASYYAAQWLIVRHAREPGRTPGAQGANSSPAAVGGTTPR